MFLLSEMKKEIWTDTKNNVLIFFPSLECGHYDFAAHERPMCNKFEMTGVK